MKNQIIKIIFLMLSALNGNAQNSQSGVYMTFSDYQNNKLLYENDCKKEKHSIKLNDFFDKSYITVKHEDKRINLQKDSIYGILNCDEPLIRIQGKEYFSLGEKGSVWIFYKEVNVPEGKTPDLEKQYYFSIKGDGKIIPLTINNIKCAFPDNQILPDLVDAQMKSENDIWAYDSFHKMFKINYLINSSINNYSCQTHPDEKGKVGDKCPKCGMDLIGKK